jgi:hypothetical protein
MVTQKVLPDIFLCKIYNKQRKAIEKDDDYVDKYSNNSNNRSENLK